MNIDLADVTLHVDETLDSDGLADLENAFRSREGVVSVHVDKKRPHLFVLEYNPQMVNSKDLLSITQFQGLHAELIGL
ncbi:MAG: ATP-binding protein [Candidatus Thiodiazotropha lotti]|uniref:ATP-binding protein n=1 Tax=Candidatus Thiodiazotropha endoloripes TaxID=1818881 RepID=A0A1E2UPS2_9GAMM|nr:ATP-binding protein [Candidatus Thiodiazotropha endoloripes]MCG7898407.1 ATP-binding protein [Candidatus Thiodiazotropha weberae]MCG7930635.1 ATP-binding protein [Candidatus Thiodiazotropha lotti]MCG7902409.1 ATP-binding protein [Candidatus Thiodiazotropha weberae]MCG7912865.1 ATP-binding protein [Candidatus Thiodiazotropha weberae]MCG7992299.1 ATP-binding protein [Candidatus Thiodiazotropha lotti]